MPYYPPLLVLERHPQLLRLVTRMTIPLMGWFPTLQCPGDHTVLGDHLCNGAGNVRLSTNTGAIVSAVPGLEVLLSTGISVGSKESLQPGLTKPASKCQGEGPFTLGPLDLLESP